MPTLNKISRILALPALLSLFIFGCPIYELFGITCPCCGVTRAWLAFVRGDLALAFQYHLFFPVIPVFLLLFFIYNHIRFTKRTAIFLYTMGITLFLYNVMRWIGLVNTP